MLNELFADKYQIFTERVVQRFPLVMMLNGNSTEEKIIVKATALDEYFQTEVIVDFIKIDIIEGAAGLVIGGRNMLGSSMQGWPLKQWAYFAN